MRFPKPEDSFRSYLPARLSTPVVLSVPHSGVDVEGFEDALDPTMDVRCDADLFVDRLYGVSESSADIDYRLPPEFPHVVARCSRFVCDMNRHPDDVSAQAVPSHPSPRNTDGRGFVWAVTTNGSRAQRRPLQWAEWDARRAMHEAYYSALARALERARAHFGFAILVDGHSMPSVGRRGHTDPERERSEIVPGDREGTSCSAELSALVGGHFKNHGYRVAFNDPYKGGFITSHHGRPDAGVHAIQIELRRDLYMDEVSFVPKAEGFRRLGQCLAALLTRLSDFCPT